MQFIKPWSVLFKMAREGLTKKKKMAREVSGTYLWTAKVGSSPGIELRWSVLPSEGEDGIITTLFE